MISDLYTTIWKGLDNELEDEIGLYRTIAKQYGPNHSDHDKISLHDVAGIDIVDDQAAATNAMSLTELRDSDSVERWLSRSLPTSSLPSTTAKLRILIGTLVMHNDSLRPPTKLGGTLISKSLLASCFNIPTIARLKLGRDIAYHTTYPPVPGAPATAVCHAIVACTISAAWSYNSATGVTTAVVVLSGSGHNREPLLEQLKSLGALVGLPTLIPYIILNITLDIANPVIADTERDSESDDRIVMGNLNLQQKRPFEMFGFAALRLDRVSRVLKYANVVLQMIKQHQTLQLRRPDNIDDVKWTQMQEKHEVLLRMCIFRQEELEQLIEHCNFMKEKLVALQSTVMGMMSFVQQETSQQIAEETKKDSTSMKILALMTMIFLPSTTVSTILAIPSMFDFSSGRTGQPLVSSRFWIFFAVSIPLTILTMALTWSWLRWESNGRALRWPLFKRKKRNQFVSKPKEIV